MILLVLKATCIVPGLYKELAPQDKKVVIFLSSPLICSQGSSASLNLSHFYLIYIARCPVSMHRILSKTETLWKWYQNGTCWNSR